jgi:hypothetical protein
MSRDLLTIASEDTHEATLSRVGAHLQWSAMATRLVSSRHVYGHGSCVPRGSSLTRAGTHTRAALRPAAAAWRSRNACGRAAADEWDRCETVPVEEERERPHDPEGPSGEGAAPGDRDYHLHTELGEETKRLATHPRAEAHRLVEELREGETETTPLIAVSGLALWLGVLVAIVIALVFLIARLAS